LRLFTRWLTKGYRALNEMDRAKTLASGTFYLALMNAIQYVTTFIFYVVVARGQLIVLMDV
jgi:hypothetical protein